MTEKDSYGPWQRSFIQGPAKISSEDVDLPDFSDLGLRTPQRENPFSLGDMGGIEEMEAGPPIT